MMKSFAVDKVFRIVDFVASKIGNQREINTGKRHDTITKFVLCLCSAGFQCGSKRMTL